MRNFSIRPASAFVTLHISRRSSLVAPILLQRHEDCQRLHDVQAALSQAGVSDHPMSEVFRITSAANCPTENSIAEALLADICTAAEWPVLCSTWCRVLMVFCPRMARTPAACCTVLRALSRAVCGFSSRGLSTPVVIKQCVWLHLVVLKVLNTTEQLAASMCKDAWSEALQRHEALVGCCGMTASVKCAILLRQHSFLKSSGIAIGSTNIGRLLSEGTFPSVFPAIVVDATVVRCWNFLLPIVERNFSDVPPVWPNRTRDPLVFASSEELMRMNEHLSQIGRGSSPSTVA
jgi:hypothetical protein